MPSCKRNLRSMYRDNDPSPGGVATISEFEQPHWDASLGDPWLARQRMPTPKGLNCHRSRCSAPSGSGFDHSPGFRVARNPGLFKLIPIEDALEAPGGRVLLSASAAPETEARVPLPKTIRSQRSYRPNAFLPASSVSIIVWTSNTQPPQVPPLAF